MLIRLCGQYRTGLYRTAIISPISMFAVARKTAASPTYAQISTNEIRAHPPAYAM